MIENVTNSTFSKYKDSLEFNNKSTHIRTKKNLHDTDTESE